MFTTIAKSSRNGHKIVKQEYYDPINEQLTRRIYRVSEYCVTLHEFKSSIFCSDRSFALQNMRRTTPVDGMQFGVQFARDLGKVASA